MSRSSALAADEPLFKNADHALRFAYGRRSAFIDSVRYITDMIIKGGGRGPASGLGALSPEERVAQAAMILAFVGRMRDEDQACIEARYSRDRARGVAQQLLTQAVLPSLTGLSHRKMIYELVARHYGKRVHLGMLARRFDVHRNTVMGKRQTIERELQKIEIRADGQVIEHLQRAGLLE
jgi:hypothetical protein